jgi:RimJ/RimL family protein N-acetyltransferase
MAERQIERTVTTAVRTAQYLVRRLTDPEELRGLLEPRRVYAAYALGQLEPALFPQTEWWLARGTTGEALLLHSRGGLGNALWAAGDLRALDAALSLHPGPHETFLTCEPQHAPVVARHFHLTQPQSMMRLQVTAETFRPLAGEARLLSGPDVRQVNRLYRSEGTPTFYAPAHIEQGVYFGIYLEGRLASVAGTHAVSPTYGIAVVGNVYTHPSHRNQALGTIATSAVTEALLRTCRQVVLSVEPANRAAVRLYEKLGYRQEGRLVEASAVRRDPIGLAALLRRLVAGRRGHRFGGQLVEMTLDERKNP